MCIVYSAVCSGQSAECTKCRMHTVLCAESQHGKCSAVCNVSSVHSVECFICRVCSVRGTTVRSAQHVHCALCKVRSNVHCGVRVLYSVQCSLSHQLGLNVLNSLNRVTLNRVVLGDPDHGNAQKHHAVSSNCPTPPGETGSVPLSAPTFQSVAQLEMTIPPFVQWLGLASAHGILEV